MAYHISDINRKVLTVLQEVFPRSESPSEGIPEQVGEKLAGFREVRDSYERNTVENRPYNVYTMVHGATFEEVGKTVARMSKACRVSYYRILVTEKELKKVPTTYITKSEAKNTKEDE
jgi:DNA-binding Lrp family transcriptional regulator